MSDDIIIKCPPWFCGGVLQNNEKDLAMRIPSLMELADIIESGGVVHLKCSACNTEVNVRGDIYKKGVEELKRRPRL